MGTPEENKALAQRFIDALSAGDESLRVGGTYLDQLRAHLGRAFGYAQLGDTIASEDAIASVRTIIEATQDALNKALVGLASAQLHNADDASYTEEEQRTGTVEYNFGKRDVTPVLEAGGSGPLAEFAAMTGTDAATYTREAPGMSAFALEDGVLYHTYSAYARGMDALWGMYQWLDRAPKGRNETGPWFRRRDEYGKG